MAEAVRRRPFLGPAAARSDAPRNRDRIFELAVGICIVGVLQALFLSDHYAELVKARMSHAFIDKTMDETALLETLAVEGTPEGAQRGEIVSLVNLHDGRVSGLKFFLDGDTLYLAHRACRQATVQEIAGTLNALPKEKASEFAGLEPVELPAEYTFKVCREGSSGAR